MTPHATRVAGAFDACADGPDRAPRLTNNEAAATVVLATELARAATTLDGLRYPRFLMRVLDNTAVCGVSTSSLAVLLRQRAEALTPPPEPTFTTWCIQYQASIGGGWTTVTQYNTYAQAHLDLPTHKRSPGNYRIVGIVD